MPSPAFEAEARGFPQVRGQFVLHNEFKDTLTYTSRLSNNKIIMVIIISK